MAVPIPESLSPHPDYPVGSPVRVRALGRGAKPVKQQLAGRVGTVVRSARRCILVEFDGEKYREQFTSDQLDAVPDAR